MLASTWLEDEDGMLEESLKDGAAALGVPLSPAQAEQLMAYLRLIGKWNKVYNLTAVREPADMLTHHLLDSLAVIPPLRRHLAQALGQGAPARLLDVGAGAGLPGVVIAICCPEVAVSCVDTVSKKARFIQQVALELRLPNLAGVHARVETLTDTWDVVTSRAFASLADFTVWSAQALAPQGVWMALKGKHPEPELEQLGADIDVFHVEQLQVPGLDADRCLIWMRRKPAG